MNKSTWESTVKPVVVLSVIALVVSFLLALVNSFTAPIIEENQKAATLAAYVDVMPTVSDAKTLEEVTDYTTENVTGVVKAEDGRIPKTAEEKGITAGILTDIIQYLDTTVIPIGGGSMTVWKLLVAIVSVLLTLGVANWLASLVNQMVEGLENMSENIKVVLKRVVTVIFMVLAVIIALGTVGIDLTILSVFGGAVGVGLGFGLQKIASNYISGFIILLDKSIKIGDLVTVGGFKGRVTEINTRFTVVRNNDGVENIVPNESFVTSAVLNHSYTESTSVQYIDISVAYDADVERALAIMLEEGMRARPRIDTGRRGWAYLDTFGDSGINLRLGFWVKDPVNGVAGLKTAISLAILKRFAEEGIEVPYNQLEVNLRKVDVGEIPVRMKVQSS